MNSFGRMDALTVDLMGTLHRTRPTEQLPKECRQTSHQHQSSRNG